MKYSYESFPGTCIVRRDWRGYGLKALVEEIAGNCRFDLKSRVSGIVTDDDTRTVPEERMRRIRRLVKSAWQ